MAETLPIGDVARQAGLATSAVRYYDRLGLIATADRDGRGRRYRPETVTRLRVIRYFQQAGFTLAETAELLDGGADWPARARHKRDELAARIDELVTAQQLIDAALACGCSDLEGCAATADAPPLRHRA